MPPIEPADGPRDLRGATLAGRYRLIDVIGRGGMGTVWRAIQLALSRDVAVKMLDVPEGVVSRLRTEALALAALDHPHIVRVIDFGDDDVSGPFFVMDLVGGESLERTLATRGPLSPVEAIECALPILEALTYAHRRGVVHRDLKPGNVLLQRRETGLAPKLLDFGIALFRVESDADSARAIAGTPAYMAPEQARGAAVDGRADVWGAAAMLYEMLEGVPPFGEGESAAVVARLLTEPPRAARLAPPTLEAILLRALEKDPARRTPSAEVLRAELRAWHPSAQAPVSAFARTLASTPSSPTAAVATLDALVRSRLGGT